MSIRSAGGAPRNALCLADRALAGRRGQGVVSSTAWQGWARLHATREAGGLVCGSPPIANARGGAQRLWVGTSGVEGAGGAGQWP